MNSTDGLSAVLDTLEPSLCSDPEIEFAVVFGSHAAGDPRPSSDIDVAIKFVDALSPHERFQKRCFLSGDLQREGAPFIDVSDLETLPLDVANDAVNGALLCGDDAAFRQLKTTVEEEFERERASLRAHQRDVIDRIATEGLRG